MKIYFLINSLESGGAERVLSILCNNFKKNIKFRLLTLKDNTFYHLNDKAKKTAILPIKSNLLMLLFLPVYYWKLREIMEKEKSSKCISFLEISNFLNILVNKDKSIISFRISLDFFELRNDIKSKIYLFLIKKLYPKANLIIVNSRENKFYLSRKINIDEKKILVINNPIENVNPNIKQSIIENNIANLFKNKTIFVSVGRLDYQKNYQLLINSFRKLVIKSASNVLLIIGDGVLREDLMKIINDYGLQDNIFLLGKKKNVYDYLRISDYFIFSSRAEGFPNVLIEAMACGLPIITTDFKTGAREIIDPSLDFMEKIKYPYYGPNGVLLSQDNFEDDLSEVYNSLVELTQKKEGFHNFELSTIIKKWERVINSQI